MVAYAEYLLGLGLAPSTVRMYRALFRRASEWASENGVDLLAAKPSDMARLREQFPESAATLRQLRCALQHYWDMMEVGQPPVRALRVPPKPRPQWRGLPDATARQLARAAVGWHPEGTATLIALYTGLRRAEVAAMRWDRFSPDLSEYTVLGKGGVTDVVPVVPALQAMLRPVRGGFVWLFPGTGRLHVHPATIWQWVKLVAEEAGVHVSPHPLRHTAVNRIWQVTKDMRVAQRFARHARIDTTEVYVESAEREAVTRAAVEALDWLRPLDASEVA